ncbi:MAG: hypothetical protein QOH66_2572, partial [Actinomycetota bacterium]|nr:hypothetical protein [Actinomycetota bacterium]
FANFLDQFDLIWEESRRPANEDLLAATSDVRA